MAGNRGRQRNLLLGLRYNGSVYHGFQVQKNALAVAEVFQDAWEQVTGTRDEIKGCSRTDSGVHANHFSVSVKTDCPIPEENLIKALNIRLPWAIAITTCREVPLAFHARYDCIGKRYVYLLNNSGTKDPFRHNLVYNYRFPLKVEMLNEQCKDFLGTHDFSSFCAAHGSIDDKVRTITLCGMERQGDLVTFTVEGDGFLYNMVRIMVGTILDISASNIQPGSISNILEAGDRARAGVTAPACGLYLDNVFYKEEDLAL